MSDIESMKSSHTPNPPHAARPGRSDELPRIFIYGGLLLICLLLVPPAVIARVRAVNSPNRRIHLIQDMDNQTRYKAQQPAAVFADGRSMRPSVEGTIARGDVVGRSALIDGGADGKWLTTLPEGLTLNEAFLTRGQERFTIYCALCHGDAGFGDGIVHVRATALVTNVDGPVNGSVWVAPKSIHDPTVIDQPVGQIFSTVTHGIRNMAGYAAQIPVEDRWAIASYVKTLQRSQNAREQDVPADKRALLPPAR